MIDKKKSAERANLGANISDFTLALQTPSFSHRYQELLENFKDYDGKVMNQLFSKLRGGEYFTKEEEALFDKFLNDKKVNYYVITNIERSLKENIRSIRSSWKAMNKEIDEIPKRIERIQNDSILQSYDFATVDVSVIDSTDNDEITGKLIKKYSVNGPSPTVHRITVDSLIQNLSLYKTYLEGRINYANTLAECLENIVAIPCGGHIVVFKEDEKAGSLYTLKRLVNIQQATHEVSRYLSRKNTHKSPSNLKKSVNKTTILNDGPETIGVLRNDIMMEFSLDGKFIEDNNEPMSSFFLSVKQSSHNFI